MTKDGHDANLFDARVDRVDGDAFSERCADDRHHFRFIISPEDAGQMEDLRAFDDLDLTGDARVDAIVEVRRWQDATGKGRVSLATRSDLPLRDQIGAPGATWLDRQLIAREPLATGNGFGIEIRDAMEERARVLEADGLARRQGGGFRFDRDLIETLRNRELAHEANAIAARTGLAHRPSAEGEFVSGVYRERVTLASGRFAMIDDGLGFQLVPWRPALDPHLGQHITGTMGRGGGIDWALGRGRGLGL